jgi:anti-sigma-K factor RskA
MKSEHPDPHLLDEYTLKTLPERAARRLSAHVQGCATCWQHLEDREELLGSLALLLPSAEPPAGIEEAIMQRIKEAPLQDGEAVTGMRPAHAGRPWVVRGFFGPLRPVLGAVAAVLIIALAAGNLVQWLRGGSMREAAAGLSLIVLVGQAGAPGAYGTVVLDPKDNGGVLAVRGLPRLDSGHVYQLWLYKSAERWSCGVFGVGGDGYGNLLLEVPKGFREFTGIGITIEPTGGSPLPSGQLVAKSTR